MKPLQFTRRAKHISTRLFAFLGLHIGMVAGAAVLYVDLNSPNPTPPYPDWSTAATNIQHAIDAAAAGDTVLVTDGVYAVGGKVKFGDLTNRVAVDKPITVRSVNGPWVTTIRGNGATNGTTAVRCAWLTNGAMLQGFTLTEGATRAEGASQALEGGAAWCVSTNAIVTSCVIVGNTARVRGKAVSDGTINNSLIISNANSTATEGVVYLGRLNNCTVVNNPGVAVYATPMLRNCIVYNNGQNIGSGIVVGTNTCTVPQLALGAGNFTNDPSFLPDGFSLSDNSPCRATGANLTTGTDIFGNPWADPPSVGCVEVPSDLQFRIQPRIQLNEYSNGFRIVALAYGKLATDYRWWRNGSPLADDDDYEATQGSTLIAKRFGAVHPGSYYVVISNLVGVVTSQVAQVYAVDAASTNALPPYASWSTAAANIQDAIDLAPVGALVLVTNGVYASGGKVKSGDLTNRVALDKAIRVQSVNGPWVTTIRGNGATNGTSAVRCAWLTEGASLVGFTLKNGATRSVGVADVRNGGGAWCASSNAFIGNCVIISNTAGMSGGGVFQGTIRNSLVMANIGAVYNASLNSCTVVSNTATAIVSALGGVSRLTNCIVYHNTQNYSSSVSVFEYSCTTPLPPGPGNFTNSPNFLPGGIQLSSASPCRGAGINVASGMDLFGVPWANPPSVGCAEFQPAPQFIGQPQVQLTPSRGGYLITVTAAGEEPLSYQWLRHGLAIQEDGHYSGTQTAALAARRASLADAADYQVVASNAFGVITSELARVTVRCVDVAGLNPTPPYTSWATAATNIQDAIDAATAGEIVLVTNGVYATGGKVMSGDLLNRVAVDKAIMVLSVNGAAHTIIEGARATDPLFANGPAAVRCAWLGEGASLRGFTLRNGATRSSGDLATLQSGGGIWGGNSNAMAFNCILANNAAVYGAGAAFSTVYNSLLTGNAAVQGGGAYFAYLNNCTVINNTCRNVSEGGGVYRSTARNSVILNNSSSLFPMVNNYSGLSDLSYCGTSPLPPGAGNIHFQFAPPFLDLMYHIPAASPLRGVGSSVYAFGEDVDGEPWANPPSIGHDEIVDANLVGPLELSTWVAGSGLQFPYWTGTNVSSVTNLVNRNLFLWVLVMGRASQLDWSLGDGTVRTNAGFGGSHNWTNTGEYTVTFTAYNQDHPNGVSTNLLVHVVRPLPPALEIAGATNDSFQFSFSAQPGANYRVEYATNLNSPITWTTLRSIVFSSGGATVITDNQTTNEARFYRVMAY